MKPYFSVVIVNYNLSREVRDCINSILSIEKKNNYEVIVVDNASTEEDAKMLAKEFPQSLFPNVSFYFLEDNRGFGAGNNFGVSKALGEIIFLLNPDAFLVQEIFNSVEVFFKQHQDVGVLGPKIISNKNATEKSCGYFHSIFLELLEIFMARSFIEKTIFRNKVSASKHEYIETEWVTGSAMFIPRKIYLVVTGFDEDFFLYNEEVDLCLRINKLGYKILFLPSIVIKHLGSTGSKKNYYLFTKFSYESKLHYLNKHFKFPQIFFAKIFLFAQIVIQIFIWAFLFLGFKEKASQKLKAFPAILNKIFVAR